VRVIIAQFLMSLAVLAFAGAALLAGRVSHVRAQRFAFAWTFTGWAFLVQGANSLFHDVFSLLGFLGGEGSAAWDGVLRWHPILSHSRSFLLTAFAVVLAVLLHRYRVHARLPLRAPLMAVVAGMLVGGVVGWQEPAFNRGTHYSLVAVFNVMELLAFMALLMVGITSGRMDRSLWAALGLNAFILALSGLLFAAIARIDMIGEWSPRPLHIQGVKLALRLVMVAIAVHYLLRVRRGDPIRGLIDESYSPIGAASLSG
jgi:hypothetical protein